MREGVVMLDRQMGGADLGAWLLLLLMVAGLGLAVLASSDVLLIAGGLMVFLGAGLAMLRLKRRV